MFFVPGKQYLPCVVKTEVLYRLSINFIFVATFLSLALNYAKQKNGANDGTKQVWLSYGNEVKNKHFRYLLRIKNFVLTYFNKLITTETPINMGWKSEESLLDSQQEKYLFVFSKFPDFCDSHNLTLHAYR
jgi:hypothetical protein